MLLTLKETRLGLRNSTTRLPFRYGKACLTRCPQAVLRVTIESGGRRQHGYSGDCLPPSWFDKSPGKSFRQQIDDMLAVIAMAEHAYREAFASPEPFFSGWRQIQRSVHEASAVRGWPPLLASFGSSLVERALLDAMCRAAGLSFAQAIRSNLFGIAAGEVFPELTSHLPAAWLPPEPRRSIFVRHTVGLADPLTVGEVPPQERLHDGFPQALEEYVVQNRLRYFKVKVSNHLSRDLERLRQIATIVERHRGDDYRVTLDGNEQYRRADEFEELLAAIQSDPSLTRFWQNVLLIEQPLERSIALTREPTQGIRDLSSTKPVIIDESDGELESYAQAIELGYRGVSSKCCKGVVKSVLNAGLTWWHNRRQPGRYLMTGEDLCTVGIVPVQMDLCLVATLGLEHVERNGHHYHRGLSYLPADQQAAAPAAHGDLYAQQGGVVAPQLVDGQFHIGSLQCPGFGFAVEPDVEAMSGRDEWSFASLGLCEELAESQSRTGVE